MSFLCQVTILNVNNPQMKAGCQSAPGFVSKLQTFDKIVNLHSISRKLFLKHTKLFDIYGLG